MEPKIDPVFLAIAWTVLTFLFSAGIAYGTMRLTLRYHSKEIGEVKARVDKHELNTAAKIENHEHFVRGVLFRPSGATNYPTREECEACQARCQANINANLDSMRKTIEDAEKRRQSAKEIWTAEFKEIAEKLGNLSGQIDRIAK